MSDTTPPVPNAVPNNGDLLSLVGVDSQGRSSLAGLTAPTWTIDDPSAVFAFGPAADGMSATIVPNPALEGQATVTFSAGTTNDDGSVGAGVTATFLAAVTPGNAVSVTIVASELPAPAGG